MDLEAALVDALDAVVGFEVAAHVLGEVAPGIGPALALDQASGVAIAASYSARVIIPSRSTRPRMMLRRRSTSSGLR